MQYGGLLRKSDRLPAGRCRPKYYQPDLTGSAHVQGQS